MSETDPLPRDTPERTSREAALLSDPNSFQRIFDHLHEFVGLLTPDGTILQANHTALAFAGIDISAVASKPVWESRWWIASSDAQDRLRSDVFRASKGEFIRHDERILGANQNTLLIDFTLKPLLDAHGKVQFLIPEGKPYSDEAVVVDPAQVLVEADRILSKVQKQMVVVCSYCHRIRDANQRWHTISSSVLKSAEVSISHGMCPLCESILLESMDERVLIEFIREELQSGFTLIHTARTGYLIGKTEDAEAAIENARKVASTVVFWLSKDKLSEPVSLSLAERLLDLQRAIEALGPGR